jgi:hypothetical protein
MSGRFPVSSRVTSLSQRVEKVCAIEPQRMRYPRMCVTGGGSRGVSGLVVDMEGTRHVNIGQDLFEVLGFCWRQCSLNWSLL